MGGAEWRRLGERGCVVLSCVRGAFSVRALGLWSCIACVPPTTSHGSALRGSFIARVDSESRRARRIIHMAPKYDFFASHTQRDPEAKLLAQMVYSGLEKMGKSCWLDVMMETRDANAMRE